jgi:hypothetical protein
MEVKRVQVPNVRAERGVTWEGGILAEVGGV